MGCFGSGRKGPIHLDDEHVARAEACHATIQKSQGLYEHVLMDKAMVCDRYGYVVVDNVVGRYNWWWPGGFVLFWSCALRFPSPHLRSCCCRLGVFLCDFDVTYLTNVL